MFQITSEILIDESEIQIEFVRAGGPGGQNVNKVSTAAQLRFDVAASESLADEVKLRLATLAGSRMTKDGVLMIDARRHRTQGQNRQDAIDRLVELIRQAAIRPRRRRKTAPTYSSRKRRLDSKRRRSEIKTLRGRVNSQ